MSSSDVGIGKNKLDHDHSHEQAGGHDRDHEHDDSHAHDNSLSSPQTSSSAAATATTTAAATTDAAASKSTSTSTSTVASTAAVKPKPTKSHAHGHGHGHSHVDVREQSRSRMIGALIMLALFMVVEAITGFTCGSLALLADAGHMLGDVAGLSLALLAIWFSSKPATPGNTYGYYRSEILAGFLNSLALVGISLFIMYEAYQRFFHPPEIQTLPTFIVAVLGFTVNIVSLKLLSSSAEQSINAKAAYLEILSDSLASVGVIISTILIMVYRINFVDALVSGLIALAILPRTYLLLKECMHILMEGTPSHIELDALRAAMLAVPGVTEVHDVHVWTITSGLHAMSAHVTVAGDIPSGEVLNSLTTLTKEDFGIHHTTIQVEFAHCARTNEPCKS
jgi:cobalt-zinc-cadmium efflux system protein